MDHYLDIRLLPDLELSAPALMNNLFAKLHRALGHYGKGDIGVSFPQYDRSLKLGEILRLHGSQAALHTLMEQSWMQGLRDYTRCGEISPVPDNVQYRTVKRLQKKSAHNKRQRSIAKGWLSEQDAFERIPDTQQTTLRLPFLQFRSLSNGNLMRIYIQHGPLRAAPQPGTFSVNGLSATATIPWF